MPDRTAPAVSVLLVALGALVLANLVAPWAASGAHPDGPRPASRVSRAVETGASATGLRPFPDPVSD